MQIVALQTFDIGRYRVKVGSVEDLDPQIAKKLIADGLASAKGDNVDAPTSLWLPMPAPTGNANQDHDNLFSFFTKAPPYAIIKAPQYGSYTVWAGAIFLKRGQILLGNNATIKRANEVVTTTTANWTPTVGLNTVPVASVANFRVGQYVTVYGTRTSDGHTVTMLTAGTVVTIGANSLVVNFTQSLVDFTAGASASGSTVSSGATFMTKGQLIDAFSNMDTTCKWAIENLLIDGNLSNNTTNNTWYHSLEFLCQGRSYDLNGIEINNACGEGAILTGENPRVDGFRAMNLNGNGLHLNDTTNDAYLNNIVVDTCNLQAATMGHANGGIIASSNIFRSELHQFRVVNSRLAGVAAWDSADNSFAKITKGYIENCWQGLWNECASQTVEGIEIRDVEVKNCGMSSLGVTKSNVSQAAIWAKKWRLLNLKFYDSTVIIQGLQDSEVQIDLYHSNSGTLTSTNTAAKVVYSSVDNYTDINGRAIPGMLYASACQKTKFDIRAEDGGSAAAKYNVVFGDGAGGPCIRNIYNVESKGNTNGVNITGVHIGCSGLLQGEGWVSGNVGINIAPTAHGSTDAAFASGYEKPRDNDFRVNVFYDTVTANNTFCLRVTAPSSGNTAGWLKVGGRVHVNAASAVGYGSAFQGTPSKLLVDDLTVVGPSSNFQPFNHSAADATAGCRVRGLRTYPAPPALTTNWTSEDTGPYTLPA